VEWPLLCASCRLLCHAPRTPMIRGGVPGTPRSPAAAPGKIWPLSQCSSADLRPGQRGRVSMPASPSLV
jgi:hypothetical protein